LERCALLIAITSSVALAQNDSQIEFENAIKFYKDRDYHKAAELFRTAAEQGHAGAQFSLGGMYNNGEGVTQSTTEAYEWILRSAKQNYIPAILTVGEVYMGGSLCQTVPSDADIGGGQYISGASTCYNVPQAKKNHGLALEWFGRAGDNAHALQKKGEIYHFAANYDEQRIYDAVKWYRLAAEKGDTFAQASLSRILTSGQHGHPRNLSEARSWDRRRREICASYKARGIKFNKYGTASIENKFGIVDPEAGRYLDIDCGFS
jgi:TPR repeat protein